MCIIRIIKYAINLAKDGRGADGEDGGTSPSHPSSKEPTASSLVGFKTQQERNFLVIMVLGMTSAIDFVMSMMSIQSMYYVLGGQPALYGLCVGIYDLGQIVLTPVFGKWAAKTKRYFPALFAGALLQILGNVLYSLIFYIDSKEYQSNPNLGWQLMIVARSIAGCGSAVINLGSTYITNNTSFNQRFGALGSYRIWQTVARMVGPLVGFIFIGLPTPVPGELSAETLINFYTIPGWVAWILSLCSLILVVTLFRDDATASTKILDESEEPALEPFDLSVADKKPGSLFFGVMINNFVQLLFGFVNWAIAFQLFGLGFAQYRVITSQSDIWKPYIGLGAGALGASLVWRSVTPKLQLQNPELMYSTIGTAGMAIAAILFIPFAGTDGTTGSGFMYAGAAFLGVSNSWFFSNQEISYSKQLSHCRLEVGSSLNMFMSWYGVVGAFSRFLGPFVTGYVMQIVDQYTQESPGFCVNEQDECCMQADVFRSSGCELTGASYFIPILSGIAVVAAVLNVWYNYSLLGYPKEQAQPTVKADFQTQINIA